MPNQSPENFAHLLTNRVTDASKQMHATETRRDTLTRRGRPPKPQGEDWDPNMTVESVHRHRPLILADVPDIPENANQILCAFMFSAMEILAGIAENKRVPLAIRRDAAKILVDSGLSTIPKRVQSVSASVNAKTVEDLAKIFDRVSPDQLDSALHGEATVMADTIVPLGKTKELTTGVSQMRPGMVKHHISVEDKILELVSRYGTISLKDLAERIRGLASAKAGPWKDVLTALVDRGTLEVVKGPRGGDWFKFSTKESEKKEEP